MNLLTFVQCYTLPPIAGRPLYAVCGMSSSAFRRRPRGCVPRMSSSKASQQNTQVLQPATLEQLRHGRTFARECWRTAIERTGIPIAIDATAGRGSDTITLGKIVGCDGIVYAIDIQEIAVAETRVRYSEEARKKDSQMGTLRLAQRSHEDFGFLSLSKRAVSCVVYNLGWYPGQGADRSIITKTECTVASLRSAEDLVVEGGIIFVTAYVGHSGGLEEDEAVRFWAEKLDSSEWNVIRLEYPNRGVAPRMLICERLK